MQAADNTVPLGKKRRSRPRRLHRQGGGTAAPVAGAAAPPADEALDATSRTANLVAKDRDSAAAEVMVIGRDETAPGGAGRLAAIDVTRGVALLGMMAVHALWDSTADGSPSPVYEIAAGRSAATFAVLAGLSIAFMTRRKRVTPGPYGEGTIAALVVRALAIGTVGMMIGHADPDIVDVILPYYGMLFLLAVPLVFLGTRALVAVGLFAALVVPLLSHAMRMGMPLPELGNLVFADLAEDPGGVVTELVLTGFYPALPWLTYLCAGLVIGRMDLSSAVVARRLLWGGIVLAAAAAASSWLLLNAFGGQAAIYDYAGYNGLTVAEVSELLAFGPDGTTPTGTWWWLTIMSPHSSTTFDLLHTTGCAAALLGAMLIVATRVQASALLGLAWRCVAAVGTMTLTLYVTHVVFMNSPVDFFSATGGYLFQVGAAIAFAALWQANISRRGPLESIVTWLAKTARAIVLRRNPEPHAGAPLNGSPKSG